jgi:ubiquinone biosynthesis protein UbiJ
MNTPFKPWGAGVVAAAINHLLEQQPSARASFAEYHGAVFRIAPTGPKGTAALTGATGSSGQIFDRLITDFTILEDGRLSPGAVEPPRVTLQFELSPNLALDFLRDGSAGAMRRVRIEGDAALATAIAGLARQLRWDVEEDLSHVIGDLAAHRVGETVRSAAAGGRDLMDRARTTTLQWLIHDDGALVGRPALESFRDDLRRLRDDVERLAKRVERLDRPDRPDRLDRLHQSAH